MSETAPHAGGLRDRVQFQRKETSLESEGGAATVYVPMTTLWARVTALGGRLSASADARVSALSHTVVIRFRVGVNPGDRFIYRGRALEVLSAEDISGQRAFLACRCAETAVVG